MSEVLRTASCQCGSFRAIVLGEPDYVNICHCRHCQRRTGVPMSCHAHFKQEQVRLEGEYKVFVRCGQERRTVSNHFCPQCGTTVCWRAELRPGHVGIAIGTFNDPGFPRPTLSLWEECKYAWIELPDDVEHHARWRPGGDPAPLQW